MCTKTLCYKSTLYVQLELGCPRRSRGRGPDLDLAEIWHRGVFLARKNEYLVEKALGPLW